MRHSAMVVALLVTLLASAAIANPVAIDMHISFDPDDYVPGIMPAPSSVVNAYVVLDWLATDVYAVSFRLAVDPLAGYGMSFTSISPISTLTGDWETGVTVIGTGCLPEPPVVLGYLSVFYFAGGVGSVEILPHQTLGHVLADCSDPPVEHEYCYTQGGMLGMLEAPDIQVFCSNPVEDHNWGAIKALYR